MKKPPHPEGGRLIITKRLSLERANQLSLWALGAFADLELNWLVLFERTEAVGLNLGVVDEKISGSVVRGDETKALFAVEPLHSSLCHIYTFFLMR